MLLQHLNIVGCWLLVVGLLGPLLLLVVGVSFCDFDLSSFVSTSTSTIIRNTAGHGIIWYIIYNSIIIYYYCSMLYVLYLEDYVYVVHSLYTV